MILQTIKLNRKIIIVRFIQILSIEISEYSCSLRIRMKIKFVFGADQEADSVPVHLQEWTVK
jgi:hypothetical protein